MKTIDKAYNHDQFEEPIYKHWEETGYFRPEVRMKPKAESEKLKEYCYDREIDGKPFVISMPPPNITGKLHLGHVSFVALEDIMTRYHRLKGEPTLWVPGTDHAGIATQTVVDKMLKKKGINRYELGREKFVEEVWKWKEEYGSTITKQLRRLGASCDWSRERFTLDEGLNEAVRTAFVELYNKGLIYRGERVVNWCPKCQTAIADDEVEYTPQKANLYYFRYDKNFPITIATTRPETKLGDTGVAVNPADKRYGNYIGKTFHINIDGIEREIKVFGDRAVDMKFGTGAVGVTPAHSMVDWKMAEENNLPIIKVINEYGKMNKNAGKYEGMKAKEAGEKLVEYLKNEGLLEKVEEFDNNLSVCYRCGTAIEPIPSKQWFVKIKPLAEKAKAAVESGEIKIVPSRFEKVYFQWMDNIRDWCISRQLWWGHRLPVWTREIIANNQFPISKENPIYKTPDGTTIEQIGDRFIETYVGINPPLGNDWEQDPDVLDTWFSSGLWPFSSLGWPEKTTDLNYFFPTTLMETGYDILFFWVARMIMMSLELTGKSPFETVYLHGLVRDEQNRKMSKSLGNVLDPLDLIPKYGTDAVRMALIVGSTPGQDVAVGESKIKGFRNFSNKIWNASRFVALRVSNGDLKTGETGDFVLDNLEIDESNLTAADRNILEKHNTVIKSVTTKLDKFRFSQAGEELYDYFWHDFCDVYIEEAKNQLESERDINTKKILIKILTESLTLLHPFVPFVTEAVWQQVKAVYRGVEESVMISNWPKA